MDNRITDNLVDLPTVLKDRDRLVAKNAELKENIVKMSNQLEGGRDYLMTVLPQELTVSDALESFGFGRNGLGR